VLTSFNVIEVSIFLKVLEWIVSLLTVAFLSPFCKTPSLISFAPVISEEKD
jgi:hypothetical protein